MPRIQELAKSPPSDDRSLGLTIHHQAGDTVVPAGASTELPVIPQAFLDSLLRLRLLSSAAVKAFRQECHDQLSAITEAEQLGELLVGKGLLTQYQLDRVLAGTTHGLVLGNHKVLDRLGAGGMGVVFLAEHLFLNRREAIKVLPVDEDCDPQLLQRFYTEMQVLASLRHPNIVAAYDAGQQDSPGVGLPTLLFLAMELVSGGDLENHVVDHGPVAVAQACQWIQQAALGLQEAHDHGLIHRDIKPSNLLLDQSGREGEAPAEPLVPGSAGASPSQFRSIVKIVDFGLVRQLCRPMTRRGALLGSIDYMPPEQSFDASAVGTGADIYGLGASLFWLLTGEPPYPRTRRTSETLEALRTRPARLLRTLRPEAPRELEAVVERMLDRDPSRRPAMPLTVARMLAPFASIDN